MLETTDRIDIEAFISALRRDYSKLALRIREVLHSVKCEHDGVTLRMHFPAIARGQATIPELVNAIQDYITPFALHRSQIEELESQYGKISAEQYRVKCERLQREANSVFIRAHKNSNKNGEAGELLLFILTEWILRAPQLLAKLPLKTSRDMPVFGADGIHIGYWPERKTLCIYWGEAKFHTDIQKAIQSAAKSIETAIRPAKREYELALVTRHIDALGVSPDEKNLLLSFLNPFENENYNQRVDVTTCLIGFDFDAYDAPSATLNEDHFTSLALAKLQELSPQISAALKSAGLKQQLVEFFLFPIPSVQDFRDQFQTKIGWKDDSGVS